MISRYRISLGGVQLDSLDDNLRILDIGYPSANYITNQNTVANADGYELTDERLEKTTVTVTFELHIYDVALRNEVCQKVRAWAKNGGTLITNDRKGQRLQDVKCELLPSIESAKNWTDPITMTFATTYNPHWQSVEEKSIILTGKNPKGTLKMDGSVINTLVSVDVVANENVTNFKIIVGTTNIELKGISLSAGQNLVIDYVKSRYLRIRVEGASVLGQLQPNSSDRLMAKSGINSAVNISANGKVTATVRARGCWV